MVTKIELRVHAGAPSGRRDDDRYRAQAEAYVGFRSAPVTTAPLPHWDDGTRSVEIGRAPPNEMMMPDPPDDGTTALCYDASTFVEDTQLAYTALESQLHTSSLTVPDRVTPLSTVRTRLDSSPWPEDLERGSQQVSSPDSARSHARSAHAVVRQRLPAFKPPDCRMKCPVSKTGNPARAYTEQDRPLPPSNSSQSDRLSQTSYLQSPFLVRARNKRHSESDVVEEQRVETSSAASAGSSKQAGSSQIAQISPSSHSRSPEFGRSSKKVRLESANYRECTPQPRLHVPFVPLPHGSQVGIAFVGNSNTNHAAPQSQTTGDGNETTSELPSSYSLSTHSSKSSKLRLRISQCSKSDPGPSIGSHESSERHVGSRVGSQPPTVNATNVQHPVPKHWSPLRGGEHTLPAKPLLPNPTACADVLPSALESVVPQASAQPPAVTLPLKAQTERLQKSSMAVSAATIDSLTAISISIHPPEPEVSLDPFVTHVTKDLLWLTENVRAVFEPVSTLRALRPSERGYWLLDPSHWPVQLQLDFWRFLEKMIGNGNAGWGVWCIREPNTSSPSLGVVQVYCWGEVVKHVYLMLYVASKSKVRKLGLQWVDSAEEVVVQMRSG